MTDNLIERLRKRAWLARAEGIATAIGDALHYEEAADALSVQQTHIRELEEALKPFSDEAQKHIHSADEDPFEDWDGNICTFTVGDIRRAAKLFETKEIDTQSYLISNRLKKLRSVLEKIEMAEGPDKNLDAMIWETAYNVTLIEQLNPGLFYEDDCGKIYHLDRDIQPYTKTIGPATELTVGVLCSEKNTGHIEISLQYQFENRQFKAYIETDKSPSNISISGAHQHPPLAILSALFRKLILKEENSSQNET